MKLPKLLKFLLAPYALGIVESGGGGAAVDDPDGLDADGADDAGGEDANGDGATDDQSAEGAEADVGTDAANDEDEVVVSIGDEPAPEDDDQARAPAWVREVRKQNREMARALREREAEIARLKGGAAAQPAVVVGAKPTMESCDFDSDKFEAELEAWHGRKRDADELQAKQRAAEQATQAAFNAKLEAHNKAKAELKVKDFDDAEAVVDELFSVVQRGIMIQGAKNSATLKYALGKNPKTAKELAAITDPVSFTWALAQLEAQLKVTPRKAAPVPERNLRGSAPSSAATDVNLARLQAEADKTGDRSKVAKYLRDKARKAA